MKNDMRERMPWPVRLASVAFVAIVALLVVNGTVWASEPGEPEPRPQNLCTTHVLQDTVLEWQGGGIDPDPVGIEWRVLDGDGRIIAYGAAPTVKKATYRAYIHTQRNSYCADTQWLPPDLELPW